MKSHIEKTYCMNECCHLVRSKKIVFEPLEYLQDKKKRTKSGVFIIDAQNRVLLSQSYNSHWGLPKGTCEINESNVDTSIRETKEETGIDLNRLVFMNSTVKFFTISQVLYVIFFIILPTSGPETEEDPCILGSESTGCGWINYKCLYDLYKKRNIKLNRITKMALENVTRLKWIN